MNFIEGYKIVEGNEVSMSRIEWATNEDLGFYNRFLMDDDSTWEYYDDKDVFISEQQYEAQLNAFKNQKYLVEELNK